MAAIAQEATILGTVTDPSGATVPNAVVKITNNDTGISTTVNTASNGQYIAPDLHIGTYTVRAEATGFKAGVRQGINLQVGARERVDFTMQIGNTAQTVTVEAHPVAVQTDTGEISNVITANQVSNLPTNGRSMYTLYALAPGASSIQGDFIQPTAVSGDNNVSVNGQRPGHNLQLLDGGENLDRGGSSGSVAPSMEAIAEFRMDTSNYSAEYGMNGASTVTQVIKSGTKDFHANAWWFGRNDALDARNYFNPYPNPVAELRYNLYGFNAGGPVDFWKKEHKTFFFYNMEWRSLIVGQLLNQTVPLASEYPDAGGAGTGAVIPTSLPSATGSPTPNIITVPTGVAGFAANCPAPVRATLVPGAPFPANTIPDCAIDPNARLALTAGGKYGGIFPLPTTNTGQFIGGNNTPTNVREEIARIDHQFNNKFSIFGHWISEQISQQYGTTQWSGDNVPSISDTFNNPAYSAVLHLTHTISPTLLNEVAFNYDGNRIHITPLGLVSAPSGFTFNRLFKGPNLDNRIPSVNLSGVTGSQYTANWTPWNNAANDYQIRDDLSWQKGAHQLKFGFGWMLYTKSQSYFANTQGNFTFNGSFTGYDFADFLLGDAQQYTEDAVQATGQWNNVSYDAYVQDNWRATSRLSLNLGLRWDGMPHTYEANHQSSNFYPNLFNPAAAATFDAAGNICSGPTDPGCTGPSPGLGTSPNPILAGLSFYENGIGIGGVNGVPKGLVNNTWKNFGPRIGLAYDVFGTGKTVVRAGFGIMFDRIQGNDMYDGATNTPFDASPTLHNVSFSNPGLNLTAGTTISAANLPILPVNITGIQAQNYKLPTTYQFSAGMEQALGKRLVFGASYVGAQDRHEDYYQQINLPPVASLTGLVASGGAGINQLYNYKGFGAMRLAFNGENSHYNSLQLDLHGNVRQDLQVQVGYTLERAIDPNVGGPGNGGDLNNITNPYAGWRFDIGPSSYDRTNVFFTNFVYQLPFFRNAQNRFLKTAVGGWQLSGIITAESGAPINLGVSGNNVASVIQFAAGNRPNVTGPITYPKTVGAWFNQGVFSAPVPGAWGNLGFDALRGPGRDDWNLSLFKSFVISERRGSRFELRADAFNAWNHTQFKGDANNGGISLNYGASNFGAVTAAYDPREFQLGASLYF
ncbi:MAG TPA: carboxypeptidase-like regulatory domain-containing protein [Candidatus Sulfotelmatobacter sp.]|nr:carboxypeptidase-like regulatory domain-containing protein [Candidatus Sulfotelmatobacter sp.]